MAKYNIFHDVIDENSKDYYNEDLAQTKALLKASNLIFEAMEEKGINQNELAKKLKVSKGYVSRILSGNENMSIKNVAQILCVLEKEFILNTKDIVKEKKEDSNILYFEDYAKSDLTIDCTAHISRTDAKSVQTWESELNYG